jgi:hypothetical protein
MKKIFKNIKFKFLPIILLFIISFSGNSILDLSFFSINVHYILVYFFVLRDPESLGFFLIFLSGIISDVIFAVPLGVSSLSLLAIATVATYVRNVTVRITLVNDWISFIPALLLANLIYFISLYFLDYSISYLYLLKDSLFTLIFYPILWMAFSLTLRLKKI